MKILLLWEPDLVQTPYITRTTTGTWLQVEVSLILLIQLPAIKDTSRAQMLEKTIAIKAVLVAFVLPHFHRYNRIHSTPTSMSSYPTLQLLESFSALPSFTWNCLLLLQLLKPPYLSSLRSSSSSHPVTNKMKKLLSVLLLCILSLVFYLSLNSPALSTRDQVLGRRLLGERRVPAPEPAEYKLKVSRIVCSFAN